ncbi:hypothetical protein CI109_104050 [Kwoniella shandongensis]|uniref:Ataxin-3 homolog n=1 Tax=Kwoniella shandongensis TaxID=1734106 RepID=A0A5M6C1P9_9TREE|nr:uncharacterized protein CI109_004064 [Kwoniella shandongensis]KAA5527525.1 hypothetical protein CI109_004064 [Kwoniella shandongensis]
MDLVPYMYFEQQEPGSQLCAQHCLNNLLQQFTYTEFDLAEIARKLDQAENATLDAEHQNKKSYNLDDTGFFSISVLERALEVWDLTLVRWRGEAMKPYQEHPEDQAAFILHLSSHWLPLRRFAPNPPHKSASKRWYNMNSFLPSGPEWISPTYLRMVLAQAEEEGYSVFVIRKATPGTGDGLSAGEGEGWGDGGIGVLPECMADRMAVELGEPVGRSGGVGSPTGQSAVTGRGVAGPSRQASNPFSSDQPTVDYPISSSAGPSSPPARRRKRQEDIVPLDSTIAAEVHQDEFIRPVPGRSRQSSSRSTPAQQPDIFDTENFPLGDEGQDDNQEILTDEEETSNFQHGRAEMEALAAASASYTGPTDFAFNSRSYDDEDEALQQALKASMMDLPSDWVAPELGPKETEKSALRSPPPSATTAPAVAAPVNWAPKQETTATQTQTRTQQEEGMEEDGDEAEPTEVLSPEEIRRRRLARFG